MLTNREIEYRDILNSKLLENRYRLEDLIENYAPLSYAYLSRYELSQHAIEEGRTVYERLTWDYEPENLIEALLTKGKLPEKGKEPITMVLSSVAQVA